jgi:hypothetical protein
MIIFWMHNNILASVLAAFRRTNWLTTESNVRGFRKSQENTEKKITDIKTKKRFAWNTELVKGRPYFSPPFSFWPTNDTNLGQGKCPVPLEHSCLIATLPCVLMFKHADPWTALCTNVFQRNHDEIWFCSELWTQSFFVYILFSNIDLHINGMRFSLLTFAGFYNLCHSINIYVISRSSC